MPEGKDGTFRNTWKWDLRLQGPGELQPSPLCPSQKALHVLPEWAHKLTKET